MQPNSTFRSSDFVLDLLTAIAAIVLIAAVTYEVLTGDRYYLSSGYLTLQTAVCLIFIADFLTRAARDERPWRYVARNIIFLLLSIPYLNIIYFWDISLTRHSALLVCMLPMLRTFVAMWFVVRWFVAGWASRLLVSYITTVILLTYLAALMFYDYEIDVNHSLHGFGNAIWWAWMGFTTVGAAIFPVTPVGKILAVLMPLGGMLMLPIFTAYVVNEFKQHSKSKE